MLTILTAKCYKNKTFIPISEAALPVKAERRTLGLFG